MNTTSVNQLDQVGGVATQRPADAGRTADPRFQELLDRLQRMASDSTKNAAAPAADDAGSEADQLQSSLQAADDSFRTAMDLRRQLEQAFQRHQR